MTQPVSHIVELRGGKAPLTVTLSVSNGGITLEMREHDVRKVHLQKVTERCSVLYKMTRHKREPAGILLHLTEGFAHLIDGFRVLKVKHMTEACLVLDVRNTDDAAFHEIINRYTHVGAWLEPYRGLVFPKEFATLLRALH